MLNGAKATKVRRHEFLQPLAVVVILLGAPALRLNAGQGWIHATSAHFEMYTASSETNAAAALGELERARAFFLASGMLKDEPKDPVRVIAFASESEYRPYGVTPGTLGYYIRNYGRDYISLQDLDPSHREIPIHEYTHLVLQHAGLKLPLWLNEGLADFYSSLDLRGDRVLLGQALSLRLKTLSRDPWIELSALLQANSGSTYYKDTGPMAMFYAESWGLVHMLKLQSSYAGRFSAFVKAVCEDGDTSRALRNVYGKGVEETERDLRQYLRQADVKSFLSDIHPPIADVAVTVSTADDFRLRLTMAEFLAVRPETAATAEARFAELRRERPKCTEVEEALGYLRWQQGNLSEARVHLATAAAGTQCARTALDYARLLSLTGASEQEMMQSAQRAEALDPENDDAELLLGIVAAKAGQFTLAMSALLRVHTLTQNNAYEYYAALGYCQLQAKDFNASFQAESQARKWARTADQRAQAEKMLAYLERNGGSNLLQNEPVTANVDHAATEPPSPRVD